MSSEFVDYNPRVEHHIAKLIDILKMNAKQQKEVDFQKLIENLVFDMYVTQLYAKCRPLAWGANRRR